MKHTITRQRRAGAEPMIRCRHHACQCIRAAELAEMGQLLEAIDVHYEEVECRRPPLQEQVDAWNDRNPVGCEVNVRRDDGQVLETKTRSEAFLAGGHTPVVFVEKIAGYYALERVTRR